VRYGGLHQWNFDVVDDTLLVWNGAVKVNVGAALEGRAVMTAWISEHEAIARLVVTEPDGRRRRVLLRKVMLLAQDSAQDLAGGRR
jgi:hypothetical protein